MNPLIIVVIVLALALIAFGVVAFVPFGGKKLLCPASISGNVADSSNCSILGYISESNCPDVTVEYSTTPATAESCKSFVDAAKTSCPTAATAASCNALQHYAATDEGATSVFNQPWCSSKYASLSTESTLCKNLRSNITALVTSLATTFNQFKLIKDTLVSGATTTTKFRLAKVREGRVNVPSDVDLQVASNLSKDLTTTTTKYHLMDKMTMKTTTAQALTPIFDAIKTEIDRHKANGYNPNMLLGEIATMFGLIDGDKVKMNADIVNKTDTTATYKLSDVTTTPADTRVVKGDFSYLYTQVPSSTYSYLNLNTENQTKLIAALTDKSNLQLNFGLYCGA
jgi:hypothetical protein